MKISVGMGTEGATSAYDKAQALATLHGFSIETVPYSDSTEERIGQSATEFFRLIVEHADAVVAIIGAIFGGFQAISESRRVNAVMSLGESRIEVSGPASEVRSVVELFLESFKGKVSEVRLDDEQKASA